MSIVSLVVKRKFEMLQIRNVKCMELRPFHNSDLPRNV